MSGASLDSMNSDGAMPFSLVNIAAFSRYLESTSNPRSSVGIVKSYIVKAISIFPWFDLRGRSVWRARNAR
jgi:hypothetical protein